VRGPATTNQAIGVRGQKVKLLDTWLDRLVMANNIDQLDIPARS
jgi:hypothetical protein